MSTTYRTELTKAGANVSTATIIFQSYTGPKRATGYTPVDVTNYNGQATTGGTDTRLDQKITIRQDGVLPNRCMAIDANAIYVWFAPPSSQPGFVRIPIAATSYTTGNLPIPVLADF